FEAVRCLEEIEPSLDTMNNTNVLLNNGLEAHLRLLKAVRVFETNGKSDAYSFIAQRVLSAYKAQVIDPPDGPREKHFA
ncbi:MAG TPA: hypothetical protein PLF01_05830, partial [Alphaproteobacteria bacterium]|nr:hypothetical protein [Alphaproteobacteria bacterium]